MTLDVMLKNLIREAVRDEVREAVREVVTSHPPPPGPSDEELLETDVCAAEAKVRSATVREWIRSGLLPAGGPPYRVRRGDLKAYLATRGVKRRQSVAPHRRLDMDALVEEVVRGARR